MDSKAHRTDGTEVNFGDELTDHHGQVWIFEYAIPSRGTGKVGVRHRDHDTPREFFPSVFDLAPIETGTSNEGETSEHGD
jgi:hypothetical protein